MADKNPTYPHRPVEHDSKSAIAVVGIAGVFPGARDVDRFWQNILDKVDVSIEIPKDRWIVDQDKMYSPDPKADKAYSKRACLIRDLTFDPNGFDLDPKLLVELDPLYHLILEAGKHAFAQIKADRTTGRINKKRIGTILAAIALPTDAASTIARQILGKAFEARLLRDCGQTHKEIQPLTQNQAFAACVSSLPAALLARSLGLGGGSFTLDAACASSLYAVKLACDELRAYRADVMLAGGVSRPDALYTQVGFSQLRALSPTGRCAPFDETADGLVVGEGAGLLVLKRLQDARTDADLIYGVIRGIGLSNDIDGNLLAPASEGQIRAMQQAYAEAQWSPDVIDYIECHGAGTAVGDAMELSSLTQLWRDSNATERQCSIGSVKSMVGHLLTAAGAAGLIKTLLALHHKTLPPSLNFQNHRKDSPLSDSPFKVQTKAEKWIRRAAQTPLRAAVSAFGFGGINAHLLLEEWDDKLHNFTKIKDIVLTSKSPVPIAIVGMGTAFGPLDSLKDFQEAIFKGKALLRAKPTGRWKGSAETVRKLLHQDAGSRKQEFFQGGYIDTLVFRIDQFHIPPKEIPDILPQHLLMLQVARKAMQDARLPLRTKRPRMGAIVGMDFDFEATNFHLRWNFPNEIQTWKNRLGLNLDPEETGDWLDSLRDAASPPLTATRTLGALGGIIGSRVAREFRLGGPSFVVSCESASGLKALEIGVRSLQQNEADAFIIGAVDLACDVRSILIKERIKPYSRRQRSAPFDHAADGPFPGEGAAALIIKRLDQAIIDGDRVYAVIEGIGTAGGGGICPSTPTIDAYVTSLRNALNDAGCAPESISYVETHGSGTPGEDQLEAQALHEVFQNRDLACAIGSAKAVIGHSGAAAALASVVKTALCLYHEIIPPLAGFSSPGSEIWRQAVFHIPLKPQYWLRNRSEGPRRACVGAMTWDGNCSHLLLAGSDSIDLNAMPQQVLREKRRPLGSEALGLFGIEADTPKELVAGLDALNADLRHSPASMQDMARKWYCRHLPDPHKALGVSIIAKEPLHLQKLIAEAKAAVLNEHALQMRAHGGISYTPNPLGQKGELAFVFPGSGNHYVGMGRDIGTQWTEILRAMDAETGQLMSQFLPHVFVPWRVSWNSGWQSDAHRRVISDPMQMISGQVVYAAVMTKLAQRFKICPSAAIGYSLGETAALFALGAWPDRGVMLKRMQNSEMFHKDLFGPCLAARKAWGLGPEEEVAWYAVTVNRSAATVRRTISDLQFVRLLIVNTPHECVIGGKKDQVKTAIQRLKCEAIFLEGVVSVHCDALLPVAAEYKALHLFATHPPEGIRFYSCALGQAYKLTRESAAESILRQGLEGFEFPRVIQQAYQDGVRVFLEMGPHSSCTRMIHQILEARPHAAVSVSTKGEDECLAFLKAVGTLIAERVHVDLEAFYGEQAYPIETGSESGQITGRSVEIPVGGRVPAPQAPHISTKKVYVAPQTPMERANRLSLDVIESATHNVRKTAETHQAFLAFSDDLTRAYGRTFAFQNRLLQEVTAQGIVASETAAFTREQCLEFAVGSVARVLGPEFAIVDTYPVRVRLPDEPLMLVDRIVSVEGEKCSLGPGRIVTEHDVKPEAWYLDGERAPVCISVEAGQADLFLCSYLGIDHVVKGQRAYRLLDATVQFHRDLPQPGDVIRYEIGIERFVRQGDTYLFFFHFEGFIGNKRLITMTAGCAGFFTEEEVRSSGGIIASAEDILPQKGKIDPDWHDLVSFYENMSPESYTDEQIAALRRGDLATCFGTLFEGIRIAPSLLLPGGRMQLIDRVLKLDPRGGKYGLGVIRAQADIDPDDWFLTCHFMDDMVMPGTLMYECCAHTLRVFIQRLGWISEIPASCYQPVTGIKAVLKCRGPVTPLTTHVVYEVEIKEIGYAPEPYVIADAHMYADGHYIVCFNDMSLKLSAVTRKDLEAFWYSRIPAKSADRSSKPVFKYEKLLEFSLGKPSKAFGKPYTIFDKERFIARLPNPPYLFMQRVSGIEPKAWVLKPDGWIESEFDIDPVGWYFRANRTPSLPYCVLNELALQPCGWLAAYMGSALKSKKDLRFRNLGGDVIIHQNIYPASRTLTTRARLAQVSEANEMIIEHFEFQVCYGKTVVYEGKTYFGFFTDVALAQQVGIRDAAQEAFSPSASELQSLPSASLIVDHAPFDPHDPQESPGTGLSMPARALRMIDHIDIWLPDGGPHGLGFVRGRKVIQPDEWFFKAHFYQDPVCPGSLGLESFLQLLKFAAIQRWPNLTPDHCFELSTGTSHTWTYRGQILPQSQEVVVEAAIILLEESPRPSIRANGFLQADGIYIYKMENFGITLRNLKEE